MSLLQDLAAMCNSVNYNIFPKVCVNLDKYNNHY